MAVALVTFVTVSSQKCARGKNRLKTYVTLADELRCTPESSELMLAVTSGVWTGGMKAPSSGTAASVTAAASNSSRYNMSSASSNRRCLDRARRCSKFWSGVVDASWIVVGFYARPSPSASVLSRSVLRRWIKTIFRRSFAWLKRRVDEFFSRYSGGVFWRELGSHCCVTHCLPYAAHSIDQKRN